MRPGLLLPIITLSILVSCKKETAIITTDPPPPAVALLKDIVVSHLPSPYYHFEYSTTGRIVFASFASDFTRYEFVYQGDRLTEMIRIMKMTVNLRRKPKEKLRNKWYVFLPPL